MVLKRGLMLALLSCFVLVSPCLAKQGDAKTMAEVNAVIEQHNQAFNAHDLKGVMTLYSSDSNTVLMGTGPGEAYVGEEGISGAYNQFFNRFKPETLSFKYDWVAAGSKGNFAWFAVTTTMSGTVNNEQQGTRIQHVGTASEGKRQMAYCQHAFFQAGRRGAAGCRAGKMKPWLRFNEPGAFSACRGSRHTRLGRMHSRKITEVNNGQWIQQGSGRRDFQQRAGVDGSKGFSPQPSEVVQNRDRRRTGGQRPVESHHRSRGGRLGQPRRWRRRGMGKSCRWRWRSGSSWRKHCMGQSRRRRGCGLGQPRGCLGQSRIRLGKPILAPKTD